MDIVDELMTPGCPQCAIKHLSAALYYKAHLNDPLAPLPEGWRVKAAIAEINLVEVLNGYKSHLWYAVGALVVAEELSVIACAPHDGIREARLIIEELGLKGVENALYALFTRGGIRDCDRALAHYLEAVRELPGFHAAMWMDDLIGSIERVREEFMVVDSEEAPGASAEAAEKGGESDMATKKAAKADPKAAKAAAKGGKAKQACGKGGCAKKGKK